MSDTTSKVTDDAPPKETETAETPKGDEDESDGSISGAWADSDDEPLSNVEDVETPEGDEADDDEASEPVESVSKDEDGEPAEAGDAAPAANAAQPPVPEGFTSWAEVAQAATRARAYEQQLLQQQAPQAPAAPQPKPLWSLPGDGNPAVLDAIETLRRAQRGDAAAVEAFKSLPGDVQSKTVERATTLEKRWARYTSDPLALVDDLVLPALEQTPFASRLRALEAKLARADGERFLQQHASVVSSEADARRLVDLLREGVPQEHAIKLIGLEKQNAALSKSKQKVDDKSRQIEANKAASRAAQTNKGRGPKPSGKPGGRIGSTDPRVIAKAVMRRLNGS